MFSGFIDLFFGRIFVQSRHETKLHYPDMHPGV